MNRAESIEEQERARSDGDKKPKSRRPASAHPLPKQPFTTLSFFNENLAQD